MRLLYNLAEIAEVTLLYRSLTNIDEAKNPPGGENGMNEYIEKSRILEHRVNTQRWEKDLMT